METFKRWTVTACLLLAACGGKRSVSEVRLAVQPPSTNNYPTHFAAWLGFYEQEGLHVSISQIAGASKVLEAVVAGSADVGGGVYEQTIQMAAEGQAVTSFVTLGRSPNFALLAATASAVKRPEDLRGKAVGVSSVGSPSQFYLNTVLRRHGIDPEDVSTVSVGMGAPAVVALDRGQVAAAVLFGSAITAVESRGATLLADSRTPMGLRDIFGIDDYPASSLLARSDWLRANPEQARKLARAVLKAIAWIQDHSAEDVLARVPAEFRVGDQTVELAAIRLAQPMYSRDGRVRTESAEAVRKVLASSLDAVRIEGIRLDRTYTNSLLP